LTILTALTLRAVFGLAYRQAEGLFGSIINLLGPTLRVPDHTPFSRRFTTLPRLASKPDSSLFLMAGRNMGTRPALVAPAAAEPVAGSPPAIPATLRSLLRCSVACEVAHERNARPNSQKSFNDV
jgi:hypothetical protein